MLLPGAEGCWYPVMSLVKLIVYTLTVVALALKLAGAWAVSWWWVFGPLVVMWGVGVAALLFGTFLLGVLAIFGLRDMNKRRRRG